MCADTAPSSSVPPSDVEIQLKLGSRFIPVLKKCVESILEGSETCAIVVKADKMILQSLDSLGICLFVFEFPSSHFSRFRVKRSLSRNSWTLNVRHVHQFLNSSLKAPLVISRKAGCALEFRCNNRSLNIDEEGRTKVHQMYTFPGEMMSGAPSFKIDGSVLSLLILEMCLGESNTTFELSRDRLQILTRCETAQIRTKISGHSAKLFKIQKFPPDLEKFENRYISKFFKQMCPTLSKDVCATVYIIPNGPIIVRGTCLELADFYFLCSPLADVAPAARTKQQW